MASPCVLGSNVRIININKSTIRKEVNNMMYTILFDATLKTKRGHIPYYDELHVDHAVDNEIITVHTTYGRLRHYRLLQADAKTFIAVFVEYCH